MSPEKGGLDKSKMPEEEDEDDLFKLSQFLTKRNQNSVESTRHARKQSRDLDLKNFN